MLHLYGNNIGVVVLAIVCSDVMSDCDAGDYLCVTVAIALRNHTRGIVMHVVMV